MTKDKFCEDVLNAAVVRQLGGWSAFKESAGDIARHGIDGGFHGFIYYRDTIKFARKHREAIRRALADDAESMGESMLAMVKGFNCLHNDYSEEEIAQCLYSSGAGDASAQIYNALAWFAAERAARAYDDATVAA